MGLLDFFRSPSAPSAIAEAVAGGRMSLTSSAAIVTPSEGKRLAKVKRPWQDSAFVYRRALPEVGYVMRYLANNSAHIKIVGGQRLPESDEPLALDAEGVTLPADLVEAIHAAVANLTGASPSGGGASILAPIVSNFETVGECWLVGRYFADTDTETWAVHSRSEVRFLDGRFPGLPDRLPDGSPSPRGYYRLVTGEGRNADGVDLDPTTTTCVRMWTADTEWSSEPDSPMRSLAGVCEALLLIERGNLAAARSRAAANGILLVPDELSFDEEEEETDGEDPFQKDLTDLLVTPLNQDGSAGQVAPGVLRGAAQYLKEVRHLTVERPMDPATAEWEVRLLARLGVGLDAPPEVITGLADVNHWNAYQISADTFKHHQEPVTIAAVEALTLGYLRPLLKAANRWDPALVDQAVLWFDASSLIAPQDQRQVANDALQNKAISLAAYRRLLRLDESDAPEDDPNTGAVGTTGLDLDRLRGIAEVAGTLLRAGYEPDSVTTVLGLTIEHTGLVPVTVKPEEVPAAVAPAEPVPALSAGPAPADSPAPVEPPEPPEGQTASAAPVAEPTPLQRRLSRRLMEIDRQLRERLAAAADAALTRALEKAGNRVRSAAQSDPAARVAASGLPGEQVPAAVGRTLVAALGLDEAELLADTFGRLRTQYAEWTATAAEEALDAVAQLAGLDRSDPAVQRLVAELRDSFADSIEASWPVLEQGLTDLAAGRMYDPNPDTSGPGELPDSLVPPGLIRQALALAGGQRSDSGGGPRGLTGLTSGDLVDRFTQAAGVQVVEYEWSYGISSRPFPPHRSLDGLVFGGFDDAALSTAAFPGSEWIGTHFAPGDHKGCHCDFMPVYANGVNGVDAAQAVGDAAYLEQNPGRSLPTRQATVDGFLDSPGVVTERPSGGGTRTIGTRR